MPLKLPNKIKKFQDKETGLVNQNFETLFNVKPESRFLREGSVVNPYIGQAFEHGRVTFSANGSSTILQSFSLEEKYDTIIYANAHAVHSAVTARVVDITQSQISIECTAFSITAVSIVNSAITAAPLFSAITTASITVYFQVVGAAP